MEIQWLKNLVEQLKIKIDFRRTNSPSLRAKNVAVVIHEGLKYSETKDLVNSVIDQQLVGLKEEAKAVFEKRVEEFEGLLIGKMGKLSEEEMGKLKEPDTQVALLEAVKTSGRKQDKTLRDLLANLVISRIQNEEPGKEELKNIVYNEAISTIGKLTTDQLKIITLCYIIRYTANNAITSWGTLEVFLDKHVKPFLGFKNTNAEFQHIEYAGCGSLGVGSVGVVKAYRDRYSFLFADVIERGRIDNLEIPVEVKREILVLDTSGSGYLLRVRNKTELDKYLDGKGLEEQKRNQLIALYDTSIKNEGGVREDLGKITIAEQMIQLWEKSNISHLSLTSVGIAIATSYFEQVTGEKVDIDIWIN